jgi:hypothetical protein
MYKIKYYKKIPGGYKIETKFMNDYEFTKNPSVQTAIARGQVRAERVHDDIVPTINRQQEPIKHISIEEAKRMAKKTEEERRKFMKKRGW